MRERLSNLLFAALLLAALLLVGFLSTRYGVQRDLSHAQRASLSEPSAKLLRTLDGPVEIVSYARRDGELRPLITEFIARYQRVKPDLALRFVDPDADPAAIREAGVQVDGELEVIHRGRRERLKVLGESELTNALLRLSRARERIVAFLDGDGERRAVGAVNADLGQFGSVLGERGVRVVPLSLADAHRVPQNTDLLVIAGPRVALAPAAVAEVVDYVERGGHLLWLTEPGEAVGLDPLAVALSLRVLPGTVVDAAGQAYGIGDPSFVAIAHYPPHAITQGFALTTLFPQPAALALLAAPRWDAKPILASSDQSWNETGHIPRAGEPEGSVRFDGTDGEIAGPLDLGFALTRLSPKPGAAEQRAVVIGDGDFLSNSFLGNGGNRDFGLRVFDWLLADDALIEVPERRAPDPTLTLSQGALGAISLGFLLGLPLLLLGIGGALWWRRRRR